MGIKPLQSVCKPRNLFTAVEPDPDAPCDDGDGLPAPTIIKARARRFAGIKEAQDALAILPKPGESLHAICTHRMDMTDLIAVLLHHLGTCDRMYIATLSFNPRNLKAMVGWMDRREVLKLSLLNSKMNKAWKKETWSLAIEAFANRGQRAAAADSHAKVITMEFASGENYWIEGSANLSGNGSGREQVMICNGADGVAWHRDWIESFISKHEADG